MTQKLHQIFKNIDQIEPPFALKKAILRKIELERKRKAERKLFLANSGLVVSLGVFLGMISSYGQSFVQSDFWQFIKLLFSDARIVSGNWKEFAFSLVETFPLISVIFILIPFFVLLLSLDSYLDCQRRNHSGYFKNFSII